MNRKKIILFVFVLLFATATYSQSEYYWFTPGDAQAVKMYIEKRSQIRDSIIKNNIRNVTTYYKQFDKKGNITRNVVATEETYDNKGDLVVKSFYDYKGRPKYTCYYTYNSSGIQTAFKKFDKKGNYISGWEYIVNANNLVEKRTFYNKKESAVSWSESITYNDAGQPTKTVHTNKKGKVFSSIETDYYTDGNKKEVRHYGKKGKLISVVKYDCLAVGVISNNKNSDTAASCTKSTYDADSNKIITNEIVYPNGKMWRSISIINKQGKLIEWKSINPKGEEAYKETHTYNDKGLEITHTFTSSKYTPHNYRLEYVYDDKGQNTVTKRYNRKNILLYETHKFIR
ncbi:MAG: hypothetical protein F9K23_17920 [Bacteroidetes bacterium]|nr:MAG: hypothetical protein F9K23_17920 [Bacteroidota bacterium]